MFRNGVATNALGLLSGLKGASEPYGLERRGTKELDLRAVRTENNAIEFQSFLMLARSFPSRPV